MGETVTKTLCKHHCLYVFSCLHLHVLSYLPGQNILILYFAAFYARQNPGLVKYFHQLPIEFVFRELIQQYKPSIKPPNKKSIWFAIFSVTNPDTRIIYFSEPLLHVVTVIYKTPASVKLLNLKYFCIRCNCLHSASQFFRKAVANAVIFLDTIATKTLPFVVELLIIHLPSQQLNAFLI